ncbi:MAG: ribosome biogenesis GTPase Der [Bdellovibrionales bacterium]
MPTVALIGRPNVGKSTLFNRLAKKALALVDDTPGLTRDRKTVDIEVDGNTFTLVDTPGLEEGKDGSITQRMREQTEKAVIDADLILFIVDAQQGLTPMDRHYAKWLRKFEKQVVLVANKCDGKNYEAGLNESYQLGYDEPFAVSAAHNDNVAELKRHIAALLEDHFHDPADDNPPANDDMDGEEADDSWRNRPLHMAIVGRPNAGKSTLVNALLGEDRMLVGPEAGLTRDAVHLPFEYKGRAIRLVDTAGMRKRGKISDKLEHMSVNESLRTIRLAHIVVLVVDATQPLESQDLTIGQHVLEEGRGLVIAINKWDAVEEKSAQKEKIEDIIESSLAQAKAAPLVYLSALKGKGTDQLMKAVMELEEVWNKRISTAPLMRWLKGALSKNPPPMVNGRRLKVKYATQIKTRPPTFALWCNMPGELPGSYHRYLVNSMREYLKLPGVPLRFQLKKSENPYAD